MIQQPKSLPNFSATGLLLYNIYIFRLIFSRIFLLSTIFVLKLNFKQIDKYKILKWKRNQQKRIKFKSFLKNTQTLNTRRKERKEKVIRLMRWMMISLRYRRKRKFTCRNMRNFLKKTKFIIRHSICLTKIERNAINER
jgi:hypothetical protein